MHDQMMRLMNVVGRNRRTKPLFFPLMSPWIERFSPSLCMSYSVLKKKNRLKTQITPFPWPSNVEKQRPQEPSLLAKRILEQSEQSVVSGNINHQTLKTAEVLEDQTNTRFSANQLKARLVALKADFDGTLKEQNHHSSLHDDSNLMFGSSTDDHQDKSVESIMFLNDLKVSSVIKPSPLLGTEDQTIPPSKVPCVGCGAMLQCQHNTFPGYLPSEHFKLLSENELKVSFCQRCHYIRDANAFLEVSAKPEEFAEMISKIEPTKSLVLLVVDVMDIQGSIVPDLMKYIGNKHPLIIVGNKADLLAPDYPGYLKNVKRELEQACSNAGLCNIRRCLLISAKTGYGIERLITQLFSFYQKSVDVYIVGTANAGKSSLFNTLLASDYCKHTARDLIQRATISVWPGTTLNLLKFPIMRPSPRVEGLRRFRLSQEVAQKRAQKNMMAMVQKEKAVSWELKEKVDMTDVRTDLQRKADEEGQAWGQKVYGYETRYDGSVKCTIPEPTPFEPDVYAQSYWTYDTPGIINPDQIMNLLTPQEAPYITPASMLIPRCLFLKPGDTIFVSGLARLDYVQGADLIVITAHIGPDIPIKIVTTKNADQFYEDNVGTATLGIPLGDKDRLMKLPSLVGKDFTIEAAEEGFAAADIQLSSLGWVSVAPKSDKEVTLRAYTPGMKGLCLRTPALMPRFKEFKGKKAAKSQFFHTLPPGSTLADKDEDVSEDK